ncbi:MAG TPA: ABC transporter substrate-binding protein [Spongiibacteraceae bacterium]|nr:ABC transporter substrate-binding protein [Spongiibacteraceae bacterium]
MHISIRKTLQGFATVLLVALFGSCAAFADTALPEPYQIVQQTTEQVLDIIRDGKTYYDKDPERFNKQIAVVMDKVVDFDSFARGVMGPYAGVQRYRALNTEQEKKDFVARIQRFSDAFKQGLIETYAKGLLKFDGQKIETLPPRKGDDVASGNVAVLQNIYGAADKPYVIQYSMRRNRDGAWKVQNVIIEGINLGLTYRNQFTAAADQYHGDLDKVIANWHVEPQIDTDKNVAAKAEAQ